MAQRLEVDVALVVKHRFPEQHPVRFGQIVLQLRSRRL
jgi:hypothetical protein